MRALFSAMSFITGIFLVAYASITPIPLVMSVLGLGMMFVGMVLFNSGDFSLPPSRSRIVIEKREERPHRLVRPIIQQNGLRVLTSQQKRAPSFLSPSAFTIAGNRKASVIRMRPDNDKFKH